MPFNLILVLTFTLFLLLEGAKGNISQIPCPTDLPDATCHRMFVPLDHFNKTSEKIPIQFGKAVQSNPRDSKTAVLILPGGPGQAAVGLGFLAKEIANLFNKTIISVDPRGTGSLSRLNCSLPEHSKTSQPPDLQDQFKIRDCLSRIGPQVVHYSTQAIVEDLEAMRRALGLDHFDLLSVSYGTVVAQMYALKYPGSIRSMILDSPHPIQIDPYNTRLPAAYKRMLKLNNVNNPNFDYEAFRTDLELVLRRLRKSPQLQLELNLTPTNIRLLYQTGSQEFVQAIAKAAHSEDYSALTEIYEKVSDSESSIASDSAFYATTCNDIVNNVPWRPNAEISERMLTFFNDAIAHAPSEAFEPFTIWEGIESSPLCFSFPYKQLRREGLPSVIPRQKDIPALVLIGELDFRTPLEGTVLLDPVLQSKMAFVKGAGHSLLFNNNSCVDSLLTEFITTSRVKNLSACS